MQASLLIRFKQFFFEDDGATTAEYAVIITGMVLTVIFVVYSLANWEGDGLMQQLFQAITGLIGSFGNISS